MGCCPSTSSQAPLSNDQGGPPMRSSTAKKGEDKVELAFKAKRANVFTEGVDFESREAYVEKNIPKTTKQEKLIRK